MSDELVDTLYEFLTDYYRDEIGQLAQHYPNERRSLYVQYEHVVAFSPDLADDWEEYPDKVTAAAEEALTQVELPADIGLSDAHVRLVKFPTDMQVSPSDLTKDDAGKYVAIRGDLARVTTKDDFPTSLAFECQRCGTMTRVPQDGTELREPYECHACDRQGPWRISDTDSQWVDYCRVRVETPPDEVDGNDSSYIDGYVMDDLVHYGHERGLLARAGEKATVYGVIERRQKDGAEMLFERHLRVEAIEFDEDENSVDIEAHREAFEALAAEPDAVDKFARSIAPELHATPEWEAALELAVAYLFAAPRIDIPDGPTYRGDIHMLVVSDFGMGKSTVNRGVEKYSPKCIRKSATALSSDVGLLAAAVKDDFGAGQWTIKPGILVRANGGHVILDEIDKPDADLSRMNDALEGSQLVDVEKAGQSATYQSRVGLLATGNPDNDRFNKHEPIAPQLGLKGSFLSRFDGIVTMEDRPDPDQDGKVAKTAGEAYKEAQESQYGDREEFDILDREVPIDVGRAWIAHARESVFPRIKSEHIDAIQTWYADEVRQLNHSFAEDNGDGQDMPVPATPRVVEACIRFSVAFARVHLRDEVTTADVDRAMSLSKSLVAQNWNGHEFDVRKTTSTPSTQQEKTQAIINAANESTVEEIAAEIGMKEAHVQAEVEKLYRKGLLTEPSQGVYRST